MYSINTGISKEVATLPSFQNQLVLPGQQELLALPPAKSVEEQKEDEEIVVDVGGETITKVKSGTDGSIMVPPTKENKQALDKIQERDDTQTSIADFLRKIYNKISGKTEDGKEDKKKGLLDYIMDFIKSPLGFIGGLLKKGAGMIFSFLNTKLFSPLKTMIVGFGTAFTAGMTKLLSPITSGVTGVIQNMFKGITSAMSLILKGVTSIGNGIGTILSTVGASLMKNKKIALSLAGMGWIGNKIYNSFFGSEEPQEQSEDQYRMWNRVGEEPKINIQTPEQNEDGRTLLGGAVASSLGMMAGSTHLGRGLGGAVATAAYDYYHTGELPSLGGFAADVGAGAGISYLTGKVLGNNEVKEEAKAAEEATKSSKVMEILTSAKEKLMTLFEKIKDKIPQKALPALNKVFEFVSTKVLTVKNILKNLPKLSVAGFAGAATAGIGMMVVQGVFALAAFYEGFKIQITARAFNTLPKDIPKGFYGA